MKYIKKLNIDFNNWDETDDDNILYILKWKNHNDILPLLYTNGIYYLLIKTWDGSNLILTQQFPLDNINNGYFSILKLKHYNEFKELDKNSINKIINNELIIYDMGTGENWTYNFLSTYFKKIRFYLPKFNEIK